MCFRGHWAQADRSCPEREKTYLFLEVEADGLGPSGLDIGQAVPSPQRPLSRSRPFSSSLPHSGL